MPIPLPPRGVALAASLLFASALPAAAQIELTALSLQARAYESATNWQERAYRPAGLVETVRIPGHSLVDIRAVFDGPWSDEVQRVSVSSRSFSLILPDGSELEPIGGHGAWGQMTLQTRSMSARRPRDFPDEDADLHWNGIFRVPKGVSNATLRIADDDATFEGAVQIPPPGPEDDAASFAGFAIEGVRRFRAAQLEDGRDDAMASSTIAAPAGMVLAEVEIEVTGVASNQPDGDDRFTWHTHNYRLTDGRGQTLGLIGERFMRRLLDSQYNGVNVGDSTERTVLWVVPEGLAEARLLFGETEVAVVPLTAVIEATD